MVLFHRFKRATKLSKLGNVVTPYCQRQLINARYESRDMDVFNFDLMEDHISGEVQVQRTFFFSVYANANGDTRCRCKYRVERGIPCWHAVQLIDKAYRETRSHTWDITQKKWSVSY